MLLGLGGGLVPRVLSFSEVTDSNWPYLYNGQLQTDVGVSSGVVVKERVVPPKAIDRAIERKKRFEANPPRHTYEEA